MIINPQLSTTPEDEKQLAQTPWKCIKAIEKRLMVRILLDVCAQPQTKKAPYYFGAIDYNDPLQMGVDMYSQNWADTLRNLSLLNVDYDYPGRTQAAYMNPQFDQFETALPKAIYEAQQGAWVIACVKHDETTEWWQDNVRKHATFVVKLTSRVNFLRPNGEPFQYVSKTTGKLTKSAPTFVTVFPVFTPIKTSHGPIDIWL